MSRNTIQQQVLLVSLLFSSLCLAENGNTWWDGNNGYYNSGSFHSANNPAAVGNFPTPNQVSNAIAADLAISKATPGPAGESIGDKYIRETTVSATIVPSPRSEVVDPTGLNPAGTIDMGEKLYDARRLADAGNAADTAEIGNSVAAIVSLSMPNGLETPAQAQARQKELDKVITATNNRGANGDLFKQSASEYEMGIRKLTRDYQSLPNQGSASNSNANGAGTGSGVGAGSGTGTTPTRKSLTTDDTAKAAKVDSIVANIPEETLKKMQDRGIDPTTFAEKFVNREFKTSADVREFLGDSGDRSENGSAPNDSSSDGEVSASNEANTSEGPSLNVDAGKTVTFGKKKASAENDSLLTQLAAFLRPASKKGTDQAKVSVTVENQTDISEPEKRALLDFAIQWWRKDAPAAVAKEATSAPVARPQSIFDIAHRSYGTFRGEREFTGGPVASTP